MSFARHLGTFLVASLSMASCAATSTSSPEASWERQPARTEMLDPIVAPTQVQSTKQASTEDWPAPINDNQVFTFLRAEQLEFQLRDQGPDLGRCEAQGLRGTDEQKLWIKTEGERTTSEGELEIQALYSQMIAPFWDFQVGARYDRLLGNGPNEDRWFGVIGIQGFSPYEFEVEAALFVSEEADLSARLTATTDFLITQRLILQPRFETEVAAQEVPEFQVGAGLNYAEFGLRLRYEIKREFAPYLGINWLRALGDTDDLIQQNGGQVSQLALVVGLSMWF